MYTNGKKKSCLPTETPDHYWYFWRPAVGGDTFLLGYYCLAWCPRGCRDVFYNTNKTYHQPHVPSSHTCTRSISTYRYAGLHDNLRTISPVTPTAYVRQSWSLNKKNYILLMAVSIILHIYIYSYIRSKLVYMRSSRTYHSNYMRHSWWTQFGAVSFNQLVVVQFDASRRGGKQGPIKSCCYNWIMQGTNPSGEGGKSLLRTRSMYLTLRSDL